MESININEREREEKWLEKIPNKDLQQKMRVRRIIRLPDVKTKYEFIFDNNLETFALDKFRKWYKNHLKQQSSNEEKQQSSNEENQQSSNKKNNRILIIFWIHLIQQ